MSLNQGSLQRQIHAFRCTHSLICPTIYHPVNRLPTPTQSFSCAPSSSPYASALYFLMDQFTTFSIFICISLCQRPLPCFKNSFNYFFLSVTLWLSSVYVFVYKDLFFFNASLSTLWFKWTFTDVAIFISGSGRNFVMLTKQTLIWRYFPFLPPRFAKQLFQLCNAFSFHVIKKTSLPKGKWKPSYYRVPAMIWWGTLEVLVDLSTRVVQFNLEWKQGGT